MTGGEGWADNYRELIFADLTTGDTNSAYRYAKGWIGHGGGAHVEPWLVYVAISLLNRQPKYSLHSTHLALTSWITGERDRAGLVCVQAFIIWRHLHDPKTARPLFEQLTTWAMPEWIDMPLLGDAAATCAIAAAQSRRRKAVVELKDTTYVGFGGEVSEKAREPRVDGAPVDGRLIAILGPLQLPVR